MARGQVLRALRAAAGHPRLLPGALFGVLTCWAVYRLDKALGMERAGLYGAAFTAVSLWHLILSRSGFRVVLLPLLLALSAALLAAARLLVSARAGAGAET